MAFLIIFFSFKEMSGERQHSQISLKDKITRTDSLGVILILAGFASLLLAVQWAVIVYAWRDLRVWGCLLGSFLILSLYITIQVRHGNKYVKHPVHLSGFVVWSAPN